MNDDEVIKQLVDEGTLLTGEQLDDKKRAEHLAWAKKRALEYLDAGDPKNAAISMLSDLNKHEELRKSVQMGTMLLLTVKTHADMRRFIEGFN